LSEVIKIVDDFTVSVMDKNLRKGRKALKDGKRISDRVNHSGSGGKPPGLKNYGNTCFFNSLMQCLCQTEVLSSYFGSDAWKSDLKNRQTNSGLVALFAKFMTNYHQRNEPNPGPLRTAFGRANGDLAAIFKTNKQEDPAEAISFMFRALGKDLDTSLKFPYALNNDKYEYFRQKDEANYENFKMSHKIDDNTYNVFSEKFGHVEKEMRKFKDGVKVVKYEFHTLVKAKIKAEDSTLEDTLNFESEEMTDLIRHDGEYGDATKSYKFQDAPEFLCVLLGRFINNPFTCVQTKKTRAIEFDSRLKLSTQTGSAKYSLYAVSRHLGATMASGHYTAHVKSGGNWYDCNDLHVRQISKSDVFSQDAFKAAYLLFYKRD